MQKKRNDYVRAKEKSSKTEIQEKSATKCCLHLQKTTSKYLRFLELDKLLIIENYHFYVPLIVFFTKIELKI